jgi:hypothetical protein
MVNQGESNATLVYGSTEIGLFVRSMLQRREEGAKVGQKLTIEISVGLAKVALKGETATDEMSGFVFGVAKKIAVKPVVAVLEASDPVIVKMGTG